MKRYLLLYSAFLVYSVSAVFSKLASGYSFMTAGFIVFYGLSLSILIVYAILWQQILKRFALITAYANKSVVLLLGMLWGLLFFEEQIKLNMIIGAAIIISGVYILVSANE